ncbi:MAG TPA: MFS transporter [Thermoanaerobaculia bacterium]|nr:MFS transporter [Thermoanaerobaculia bacterium]
MKIFSVLWFSQLISIIGSGLTSFALGVWVYQQTGSATQFALITFFLILPGVLLSPLAGALADRWSRKTLMILGDSGSALSTLIVALLVASDRLEVWHIYLATALSSACGAFQWPAFAASIPMLVPKEQLGRANGMVQVAEAAGLVVSPLLAGVLVVTIGLRGVILIDIATFLVAVIAVLFLRIPQPAATTAPREAGGSLTRDIADSWSYIRGRSGLLALFALFASFNFIVGMAGILIQPLILSFTTPAVLGTLVSIGGSGLLLGGVVMGIWGGPKHRVPGILLFMLIGGVLLLLHGLAPSSILIGFVAPTFLFTWPIINGSSYSILQTKVAADMQGRVFALSHMITQSSRPLAALIAGPLADGVFEPLLMPGGSLAGSVGRTIGTGPGRGIALLFMVLGVLQLVTAIAGYLHPHLRNLETEMPDIVAEPASELGVA